MSAKPTYGVLGPTLGSLCTGYGGLDLAVESVFGARALWALEIDVNASRVIDARFPGVPNLGDLTTMDWSHVRPVDVLTAGYPCQPFSHAGRRKGTTDERHLWPYIADAIRVLRPRVVVLENVAGHVSLGLDVVLGDLASLGFDAEWLVVRASDVGACHRRERVFILATDPGGSGAWGNPGGLPRTPTAPRRPGIHLHAPLDDLGTPPDANGGRLEVSGEHDRWTEQYRVAASRRDDPHRLGEVVADANGTRLEGRGALPGRAGEWTPGPGGVVDWGEYEPAIRRHELVFGRPAPAPVDDRDRLSPAFVEWMMMLPEGWVTDVLPARTKALKCLGNGVVPPQAAFALQVLLEREAIAA